MTRTGRRSKRLGGDWTEVRKVSKAEVRWEKLRKVAKGVAAFRQSGAMHESKNLTLDDTDLDDLTEASDYYSHEGRVPETHDRTFLNQSSLYYVCAYFLE